MTGAGNSLCSALEYVDLTRNDLKRLSSPHLQKVTRTSLKGIPLFWLLERLSIEDWDLLVRVNLKYNLAGIPAGGLTQGVMAHQIKEYLSLSPSARRFLSRHKVQDGEDILQWSFMVLLVRLRNYVDEYQEAYKLLCEINRVLPLSGHPQKSLKVGGDDEETALINNALMLPRAILEALVYHCIFLNDHPRDLGSVPPEELARIPNMGPVKIREINSYFDLMGCPKGTFTHESLKAKDIHADMRVLIDFIETLDSQHLPANVRSILKARSGERR